MITLASITLFIFILRFVVFRFRESPKFLLAKGHDAHALDVIHAIAKFNKMPLPQLTLEDFAALEWADQERMRKLGKTDSRAPLLGRRKSSRLSLGGGDDGMFKKVVVGGFKKSVGHLKGLFTQRKYAILFFIMAIACVAE
jgi:hypothetical protein